MASFKELLKDIAGHIKRANDTSAELQNCQSSLETHGSVSC